MDQLPASRPITLTWVRGLMAGLGLSLLWNNPQEKKSLSNSLPHGPNYPVREAVVEASPDDLYRADQQRVKLLLRDEKDFRQAGNRDGGSVRK